MITDLVVEVLLSVAASMSGVSNVIVELFFKKKQLLKYEKKKQDSLAKKIEMLTNNLQETSILMADIEMEFQQKKELAEKWSEQAETSQIIASMSKKEVEAVSKIFGGILEDEEKKSNKISWWWNLFFCVLGIVGGYLVSKILG